MFCERVQRDLVGNLDTSFFLVLDGLLSVCSWCFFRFFDDHLIYLLYFPLSIATGWEFRGTTYRSAMKMLPMKSSMNYFLRILSTAKFGATPTQIWITKSPRRRSSKIMRASGSGCFVAVRSVGSFFDFKRLLFLSDIVEERIKLAPAPLLTKQVASCITAIVVPCNIWSSYVSFAVCPKLLTAEGSSSIRAHKIAHLKSFLVFLPLPRYSK